MHLNNPSNEPVSLERYSALNKMPPFMVWEQIKKGKILAREINGEIYILPQTQASSASSLGIREGASAGQLTTEDKEVIKTLVGDKNTHKAELPSLPNKTGGYLGLNGNNSESPEVALLLDHLSIAKEENQEILKMAQKSLEQVKEITREIVSAKDEVIQTKEEKIKLLEEKLLQKDNDLNKTRQKLEDLEILTKTLSSKN